MITVQANTAVTATFGRQPGTGPSAIVEQNGNLVVYYVGTDGGVHLWIWNGTWQDQSLGGSVAANTSPSAIVEQNGNLVLGSGSRATAMSGRS